MRSRIKWVALAGIVLSFVSLLVHLFLAKSSDTMKRYGGLNIFMDDLFPLNAPGKQVQMEKRKRKRKRKIMYHICIRTHVL